MTTPERDRGSRDIAPVRRRGAAAPEAFDSVEIAKGQSDAL
ncbi:MAG: hypothetical protein JWO12_3126, partial [Frankiales bacterium]|nr:hypothetical protein [Frankiales bacterium]